MKLDAILSDDPKLRSDALAACAAEEAHRRSAAAGELASVAKEAAAALAAEEEEAGAAAQEYATKLARACTALSLLRVEAAKSCLFRIADEGTPIVKMTLARALSETKTPEGRAVLVYLLSDDDARGEAILAIGAEPWGEVLPVLIEIAEADDQAARLAAIAIAKCGATAGSKETYAAADFLLEQLDDDTVLPSAVEALLRFGRAFPGVAERAKLLAKESSKRKAAGLCLVAACGSEGNASLLELALSGPKADEEAARTFLNPLLNDASDAIRHAAERTWKALDLR